MTNFLWTTNSLSNNKLFLQTNTFLPTNYFGATNSFFRQLILFWATNSFSDSKVTLFPKTNYSWKAKSFFVPQKLLPEFCTANYFYSYNKLKIMIKNQKNWNYFERKISMVFANGKRSIKSS